VDGLWRLLRFMARSTKRLAIFVVGMGVVVVGIVMIPAPGPGWLVVFAGLALLATEFTWAELLLERAKRQANRAKDMAVRSVQARRRSTTSPLELRAVEPSANGDAPSTQDAPPGEPTATTDRNGHDGDRAGYAANAGRAGHAANGHADGTTANGNSQGAAISGESGESRGSRS
jgi:uncharacterized protein (TIGR02611 family)